MIVPMKAVTIVGLDADREKIITGLRDLGVVHIRLTQKPESDSLAVQTRRLQDTETVIQVLETHKGKGVPGVDVPSGLMPEELLAQCENEIEHLNALKIRLENVKKDVNHLEPWGDFPFGMLQEMEDAGVYVYLCDGTEITYNELPDDVYKAICCQQKKRVWYLVAAMEPIPLDTLPLATIPRMYTYSEAVRLQATTEESVMLSEAKLAAYARQRAKLKPLRERFAEDVEFEENLAGMETEDKLVWLAGYLPAEEVGNLETFAKVHGCALQIEDPAPEDMPPTALKNNWFVNLVKPLLDFCGILPGYREWDVSLMMLLFFTIFVGMIINDAGYGMIFLFFTIIGWFAVGKKEKFRPLLSFFTLLSLSCVVWGVLSASFLGLSPDLMRKIGLGWIVEIGSFTAQPIPWLVDNKAVVAITDAIAKETDIVKIDALWTKMRELNVQYFSFILAFTQMGIAHIWKAVLAVKRPFTAISHIGWLLIMFGNLFLAANFVIFPDSMPAWAWYLYIIGIPMMCCGVNWREISSFFQTPLSLVNGFVDTLSYIRLFAVGLAGGCVAANFNSIIGGLATSWWMVAIAVVLLIVAHVVNILLCSMSVLVHAIRLNTLEFSSHMDLEWTGAPYKPFKRQTETPQEFVITHPKD